MREPLTTMNDEAQLVELRARVTELEKARDQWKEVAMALAEPQPISADIADVVAAVEDWVNRRGGDETVDQIAVMAIQAYQRAKEGKALT